MLKGAAAHCPTLRNKYRAIWSADWPYSDADLRELTREAHTVDEVLILMRECQDSLGALVVIK